MNVLDLELFDLTANNLQKSLKQLDKFYPNEKSLADYLEAMAEIPPEQWKHTVNIWNYRVVFTKF